MSDATTMVPISSTQLRSMTNYVKGTQPVIEKQATLTATLTKRASAVVDTLVHNGCLHAHLKEAKVQEFIDNPASILDTVEKLASRVQVTPVGAPAASQETKEASFREDNHHESNQAFLATLTGGSH